MEQIIERGECLHATAVLAATRAQNGPMRLRMRRSPADRIVVQIRRVEMHVGVDDRHVGNLAGDTPVGNPQLAYA